MRPLREIACELVEDFWEKGGACTQEYAIDKVDAALRQAHADGRDEVLKLIREHVDEKTAKILGKYVGESR